LSASRGGLHNQIDNLERARKLQDEVITKQVLTNKQLQVDETRILDHSRFGIVYAAKFCGSDVAITKLRNVFTGHHVQEILRKEAELLLSIHHPLIVQFFGVHLLQDDGLGIVTEIYNQNLIHFLSTCPKPLPNNHIKTICVQVCSALICLHDIHDIIHGDISSSSVILCGYGDFSSIYFKLSNIGQYVFFRTTGAVTSGGSPYAAPELVASDVPTKACDVYSFGVLCTEIGLGRNPTVEDHQLNASRIKWIALKNIIKQCLYHNPQQRLTTNQVLQLLENLVD